MSSSTTCLLTILTAMIFSSVRGYAERPSHSINILDRTTGHKQAHGEVLDNKDNRLTSASSGRPSDSDYYFWRLFNERSDSAPAFYDVEADAVDPWSSPAQLQKVFSRLNNPMPYQTNMDGTFSKTKREGHSLSIVNPLDVLRQRMMLEMARRRMKENQEQIKANDVILKTLGKRQGSSDSSDCDEDEENGLSKRAKDDRRRNQRQDYLSSHQDEEFAV